MLGWQRWDLKLQAGVMGKRRRFLLAAYWAASSASNSHLWLKPRIELKHSMQSCLWVHMQCEGAGPGAGKVSGWLYGNPWGSHTVWSQQLSGGRGRAQATVKTALREALLLVVAKCLGSLSCCPSGADISHYKHALFPVQIAPGINANRHQHSSRAGSAAVPPPSHVRQHIMVIKSACNGTKTHGNEWHGTRCIFGKSQLPFRGSFPVICLFQIQALIHKWKCWEEQSKTSMHIADCKRGSHAVHL